jgi:acetone carboxylase gamma subunit
MRIVHPAIGLLKTEGEQLLACLACETTLCKVGENYRTHVAVESRPIGALGPLFAGRESTVRDAIVIRTYRCPNCRRRLDQEICPSSAAPIFDLELSGGED